MHGAGRESESESESANPPFQAGYWVSCVGECSRTAEGQKELIQKGEHDAAKGMFPKIRVPENGWFIMENPIKMDDLGVPLFLETLKGRMNSWVR